MLREGDVIKFSDHLHWHGLWVVEEVEEKEFSPEDYPALGFSYDSFTVRELRRPDYDYYPHGDSRVFRMNVRGDASGDKVLVLQEDDFEVVGRMSKITTVDFQWATTPPNGE